DRGAADGAQRSRGAAAARPLATAGRRGHRRGRRGVPGLAAQCAMAKGSLMTRLSGADLTLAYDQRVVATGLTLEIPDGSFTVIVGPNACGKSTLLRALCGLLPPKAGWVVLDGA